MSTETTAGIPRVEEEDEQRGSMGSGRIRLETVRDRDSWWIRKLTEPKYEIDDAVYSRYDQKRTAGDGRPGQGPPSMGMGVGGPTTTPELAGRWRTPGLSVNRAFRVEKAIEGRPGWELRDRALQEGANTIRYGIADSLFGWTPLQARGPEDFGAEPYQGSPGEHSRMVKTAARFYGAVEVGVAVLDRRHVYSHDAIGRPFLFEDVDAPMVDKEKKVIPDRCRWVIALGVAESEETIARAPDAICAASVGWGYSMMPVIAGSLAEFIRALGYIAIPCGNDTALSVPIAIDAGLGEASRLGLMINPRWGPRLRLAKVITDLPLEPDSPIDFGVMEFCESCMKCARYCPSRSLSFDREPSYNILGPWNNPGHKGWYFNGPTCRQYWGKITSGCTTCVRVCPYGKRDTWWHRAAMATISSTRAFNKLIADADDWMGFGKRRHPDKFWASTPMPFGLD